MTPVTNPIPDTPQTVAALVEWRATTHPDIEALVDSLQTLTFAELAVGLALLLGLLSRLTVIGGFLLAFSTFIFTLGAETWTFDYLFEPVLFLALAIAPPLPGLDSRMPWGRPRSQS